MRYQELQSYVGWTSEDAQAQFVIAGSELTHQLPFLIDDFYDEINRHPATREVLTGGQPQIDRLKVSLQRWVSELLSGPYDQEYVERRGRIGGRHVEIGLEQIFTSAALSRLRVGLIRAIEQTWRREPRELTATIVAINKLLDLDLAIIEDAYQAAYEARLQQTQEERLSLLRERSEEKFRKLVEAAECMIIIILPDLSIAYFSPFAERLTGYSAAEALGRQLHSASSAP